MRQRSGDVDPAAGRQAKLSRSPSEADDGPRTRDLRLGKPTLYQLSYVRAGRRVYLRVTGSPGRPHYILWREADRLAAAARGRTCRDRAGCPSDLRGQFVWAEPDARQQNRARGEACRAEARADVAARREAGLAR